MGRWCKMYHFYALANQNSRRGTTLVELMAAVALSSLLTAMVFFAWNAITGHMTRSQQKALMFSQTMNISESITTKLVRTSKVIEIGENGISFLDADGEDTVRYWHDGNGLLCNNKPVRVIAANAKVVDFYIKVQDEGTAVFGPSSLLSILIETADGFGNKVALQSLITVPRE